MENLKCASLRQALALPTNIRLGLERLARDKHSILLRKFVNYSCKKFYRIGPRCLEVGGDFSITKIDNIFKVFCSIGEQKDQKAFYFSSIKCLSSKCFCTKRQGPINRTLNGGFSFFIFTHSGAKVRKLFTAVIYKFL